MDNEEIKLNEFVQSIIGNAISGAISSLQGVKENWEEIEIKIKRK